MKIYKSWLPWAIGLEQITLDNNVQLAKKYYDVDEFAVLLLVITVATLGMQNIVFLHSLLLLTILFTLKMYRKGYEVVD